ncbi:MAG: PIN domain-containing protein [Tepidisphaeraceae bacterium]
MVYFLDTNAISDLMRQNAKVMAQLALVGPPDELRICTIVRGEILFGIDRLPPGKKQNDLRERASSVFAYVDCQPIPPSSATKYSQIRCILEKTGFTLGENDLWIAACAMDVDAFLVTRDQAFRQISGLKILDWTQ